MADEKKKLFPTGRMILLGRDPYDVLDSYLDLQKPGSWNERFGDSRAPLSEDNVRRTAEVGRPSNSFCTAAKKSPKRTRRFWPLGDRSAG